MTRTPLTPVGPAHERGRAAPLTAAKRLGDRLDSRHEVLRPCSLLRKNLSRASRSGTAGAMIGWTLIPRSYRRWLRATARTESPVITGTIAFAGARSDVEIRPGGRPPRKRRAFSAQALDALRFAMQDLQRRERRRGDGRRHADAVDESAGGVLEEVDQRRRARRYSRRTRRASSTACPSRCPLGVGSTPKCSKTPRPRAPSTPRSCAASIISHACRLSLIATRPGRSQRSPSMLYSPSATISTRS